MKIAILTSIARQVLGEWVFIKVVKAHKNPEKLYKFLRENELPRTTVLGEDKVECIIEYGVVEDVEVEED